MARYKTSAQTRKRKAVASEQVERKSDLFGKMGKTLNELKSLSAVATGFDVLGIGAQFKMPAEKAWEQYDIGKEALGLEVEDLSWHQKLGRSLKGGPDVKTGGKDIWTDASDSEQVMKHLTTSDIKNIGKYISSDLETQMLMGKDGEKREWIDIMGTKTEKTRAHPSIVAGNKSLYQSYAQKFAPSMKPQQYTSADPSTSTMTKFAREVHEANKAHSPGDESAGRGIPIPQRDRSIYGEGWSDKMRGISNVSERVLDPGRKNPMYVEGMSAAERGEDFYADPWKWTDEMMVEDVDAPPMYEGLDTEAELSDTQLTQQQYGYDPHSLLSVQGKPWQAPWERQQMREAPSNFDIAQERGGVALTQPKSVNEYTGELQDTPFISNKDSMPRTQADWTRYMRGETFHAEGERMANLAGGNEYDPDLSVPSLPPEQEFRRHDRPSPMPQRQWSDMSAFEQIGQYMFNRKNYAEAKSGYPSSQKPSLVDHVSKLLKKAGGDNTPVFSGGRRGLR